MPLWYLAVISLYYFGRFSLTLQKAQLVDEERPRASRISPNTVALTVTITTLVVVIIGGCFMYMNLMQRISNLETKVSRQLLLF